MKSETLNLHHQFNMHMKSLLSIILLGLLTFGNIYGQEVTELEADSTTLSIEDEDFRTELPVDRASNFSLIFQRGFMLVTDKVDSVNFNGGLSGSFTLATSFKINLFKNTVGLRLQPGITWIKADYAQTNANTFPSVPDSFSSSWIVSSEKHRFTYLEMPIGIYVNLSKDEDGDTKAFIEAGGYFGYKMGGAYKLKYDDTAVDEVVTVKRTGIRDLEELRYGIYGRVGYKWIALYYSYRLTDIFQEFRTDAETGAATSFKYPKYPEMELGISIFL